MMVMMVMMVKSTATATIPADKLVDSKDEHLLKSLGINNAHK